MQALKKISLWLMLFVLAGAMASPSYADVDRDKDKDKNGVSRSPAEVAAIRAGAKGSCTPGVATKDLDVNNIRGRLYNNGQLFYPDAIYEVPKGSGVHSIFASGIWVGGLADGELRIAAATYAQGTDDYEFFPGPLDAAGNPPADCTPFDRIYKVSKTDIDAFVERGVASQDMLDWPASLGAPVADGDGDANNYNLSGGDLPGIIGDQTIWWVMNDAAGPHLTTSAPAIGLEVQVTAFAFNTADALNNTTFYKYKIIYKGSQTLTDTWIGLWSDPDLGDFQDDFVGSDPAQGLGFVYNGDINDENNYGRSPPALGYDFFQGPLVNSDGVDNDGDGDTDEADERLAMTRFVYYNNVNDSDTGNPAAKEDYFGYLRGFWIDGSPITFGGNGFGGSTPTDFMFPNEPPAFWSEDNTDNAGGRNTPADRRFIMSSGPFTMEPFDEQEIVFGIVWSQTADRIGSVKKLKFDDILAQGAFDFDFALPPPPDAPDLAATEMDQSILLSWNNRPASNNYLNRYDAPSPFLIDPNVVDTTFTFEGYKVYQYLSDQVSIDDTDPSRRRLITTGPDAIDVINNVTTIVGDDIDPTTGAPIRRVVAQGTDAGVRNYIQVNTDAFTGLPLRNYTEYIFGIQAYAYNAFSNPNIRESPIRRITVVPSSMAPRGTELAAETGSVIPGEIDVISDATVFATIADPAAITGGAYEARFYFFDCDGTCDEFLTFDLVKVLDGTATTLLSGADFYNTQGVPLPTGNDFYQVDGLSFSVNTDVTPDWAAHGGGIVEVANEAGPLPPASWDGAGTPYSGNSVWHSLNAGGFADRYYQSAGGGSGDVDRISRYITFAVPRDFEMRFTEAGGVCVYAFDNDAVALVPFEIWDIGVATPGDTSDDTQMIPFCLSETGAVPTGPTASWVDVWGTGSDPFFGFPSSDWVYWMDEKAGEGGYAAFEAQALSDGVGNTYDFANDGSSDGYFADFYGGFVYPIGRSILADFDGNGLPPATGTVIRWHTTKPLTGGEVFTMSTADIKPIGGSADPDTQAQIQRNALDMIGIVPNPYKGSSTFDVPPFQDEVRLTNLPEEANISIYSLNGTLIRTLRKRGGDSFIRWDLQTEDGLPIASGMYLIHVEVPGIGERVLKFGAIMKQIQLDVF